MKILHSFKAQHLRFLDCQMVYVFKALVYVLGNVLELVNVFKFAITLEQLLVIFIVQCYSEVVNLIKLPF